MPEGYVNDTDGNRITHLVGGIPAPSARHAMAEALGYLGPTLRYLPDGENPTADIPYRAGWIEPEVRAVPGLPGVITRNAEARYTSYDDTPWYEAVGPLTADDLDAVVIARRAFEASYPEFCTLRRERGLPRLRFQAGIPAPLDLALLAFRESGLSPDLFGSITEAKARQVRACSAQAPGDAVFQLETPTGTGMVVTADDPAKAASYVAGLLTDLPSRCPGTAWGVHLCDGDWYHQAAIDPSSALPLVLLATEITAQWPARTPRCWSTFTCRSPRPASRPRRTPHGTLRSRT